MSKLELIREHDLQEKTYNKIQQLLENVKAFLCGNFWMNLVAIWRAKPVLKPEDRGMYTSRINHEPKHMKNEKMDGMYTLWSCIIMGLISLGNLVS